MNIKPEYKDYIQISNSRRERFSQCSRKYYWTYEASIQGKAGATALRYGSCWHAALDALYTHMRDHHWATTDPTGVSGLEKAMEAAKKCWKEKTEEADEWYDDYRNLDHLAQSLLAYRNHWAQEKEYMKILSTESEYQVPLVPTEEEVEIFPWLEKEKILLTGIQDMLVEEHGHIWAYEHKTTSAWLSQVMNTHHRSAQALGYFYACKTLFPEYHVEGVMMNVAFMKANKLEVKEGYGKVSLDYQRQAEVFTQGDLREWRISLLSMVDGVLRNRERGLWPMNFDSCYLYNSTCTYAPLCEQVRVNLNDVDTTAYVPRSYR